MDADTSDAELIVESIAESEAANLDNDVDLIATLFATEADKGKIKKKKDEKTKQTDTAKRANIPNKIFDYIHVARHRRLFSLAWYNYLTYNDKVTSDEPIFKKPLPETCCNGASYNSPELEYL